jgi:uridine kinase
MGDIGSLLESREPRVGATRFIAIDGRGGSGKSTLARMLASALTAQIIHTDDFASWGNPLDWHSELIDKVFVPIRDGATSLSYMPTKWWDSHHPEPITPPVTEVMIIEGVSALRREFRSYITLGILVDAPRDICLRRGIERDRATGKPVETLIRMWNDWQDEEERYFERDRPKAHADFVIDGTRPIGDQIRP